MSPIDPRPILLVTGQLYVAMALAVLAVLYHRHTRFNVVVWGFSGIGMGMAASLYGSRGVAPDWAAVVGSNVCAYTVFLCAVPVLRLELGLHPRWGRVGLLWALAVTVFTAAYLAGWSDAQRFVLSGVIHIAGAVAVAWHAHLLARQINSLGVRLIALGYGTYASLMLLRTVRTLGGWSDGTVLSPQWDFLVLVAGALLASLCSNVGYMGMALDRARHRDLAQREALEHLREQQLAMEASARERTAIRQERHRSSQVLAHEVRQPLHNAAVSLQAAMAALSRRADVTDSVRAVAQAQAVIQRVTASLDNTVAAASLLTDDGPLTRLEVDLDLLANLCVADLPADTRARVRIEHLADARSARMELSLVRLAVRNLLINAALYTPSGSVIHLRLLDSDEPLALVIEVADEGPGVPGDVLAAMLEPQTANPHSVAPGHGLGLRIVQRVARLHGSRLAWRANEPTGSVFSLVLPQALPD